MKILIISSSFNKDSKSKILAEVCMQNLIKNAEVKIVELESYKLSGNDLHNPLESPSYVELHKLTLEAEGLILASPIYNWSICSELKKYIEIVGSTPPDRSLKGAFFDKIITFVNSAGLPHSYMGFTEIAMSMMLDFKCIINPYNIYAHDRNWNEKKLDKKIENRIGKSMKVFTELITKLNPRAYTSSWEI